MVITIAGLGPGDATLLTGAAREAIADAPTVVVRTRAHAAVAQLDPGGTFTACDDLANKEEPTDETNQAACERVIALGRRGDVVYAVPGNPVIDDGSVPLLLEGAANERIATRVLPGVSYLDVAAAALRRDVRDLQLCDATSARIDTQRPALIRDATARGVIDALPGRLRDIYPAGHEVVTIDTAAAPETATRSMSLEDLTTDNLSPETLLFLPALAPEADVRRFDGLYHVVARLNAPDGCPWDREQTHESLRKHLLEEAYEALDAIDSEDRAELTEELGDVLLQVLMHAEVGRREQTFSLGDVTEHIAEKLIRRHPHVFGEAAAGSADEVWQSWEQLKKQEKPERSVLDGVPATLPALAASQAIQGRARRVGFDWPDIEGPLEKLREEVGEFARAENPAEEVDEFGDILFVLANIGQRTGIDAEQALRSANQKFRTRFTAVEELARERELDLQEMTLEEIDALWDEAKAGLGGGSL